jgi:hypothetical protein
VWQAIAAQGRPEKLPTKIWEVSNDKHSREWQAIAAPANPSMARIMTQGRPEKLPEKIQAVSRSGYEREWQAIAAQKGKEVLGLDVAPNADQGANHDRRSAWKIDYKNSVNF